MSTSIKRNKVVQFIKEAPKQTFEYISNAVFRIFSPTRDDYPVTGVQPFSGEPADEK